MLTFKELRDRLEPSDIKKILQGYDIEPHYENKNCIVYETCCHNPIGEGSHKLYYYTNTHMFKCYTRCDCMFDIFDLIIRIEQFQGRKIGKAEAIRIAGFELSNAQMNEIANDSITGDLSRLIYLNNAGGPEIEEQEDFTKETIMANEKKLFGFYLSEYPTTKYKDEYNTIELIDVEKYFNKIIDTVALIDKIKIIETKKQEKMAFLYGSDPTGIIDYTMFPDIYSKNMNIERGDVVLVRGRVEKRLDKYQIIVQNIKKMV